MVISLWCIYTFIYSITHVKDARALLKVAATGQNNCKREPTNKKQKSFLMASKKKIKKNKRKSLLYIYINFFLSHCGFI